jgi:cobalt/nickel transport system permease protein
LSALQEPFAEGASLAHRLDPRGKVVAATFFAVLVAVAQTYAAALAGLALALVCLALARLPLHP